MKTADPEDDQSSLLKMTATVMFWAIRVIGRWFWLAIAVIACRLIWHFEWSSFFKVMGGMAVVIGVYTAVEQYLYLRWVRRREKEERQSEDR